MGWLLNLLKDKKCCGVLLLGFFVGCFVSFIAALSSAWLTDFLMYRPVESDSILWCFAWRSVFMWCIRCSLLGHVYNAVWATCSNLEPGCTFSNGWNRWPPVVTSNLECSVTYYTVVKSCALAMAASSWNCVSLRIASWSMKVVVCKCWGVCLVLGLKNLTSHSEWHLLGSSLKKVIRRYPK